MKNHQIKVKEIKSLQEMLQQFPLLKQLNPKLKKKDYEQMLKAMTKNGYRMIGAFDRENCVGLSGVWVNTKIWCGKYIEPDNVVVDKNYRSKGVGKLLIDWIIEEGKNLGCKTSTLDSYVANSKSHSFYFREGYVVNGFHFYREI
ncbi:MAG: hypothetical protein K0R25_1144 [Rickettsiaceae bacterium]|jgi:GNAT superfamily N-acetyltransferase|nr:hypothetical protein [Rickettsiaceae bacterium]